MRSNGDSDRDSDKGEKNDGRGMGVSYCNTRTTLGSRSRYPWSSDRKRYRGSAALGASTTRSRYGSRSGLVLILRCGRIWGEQSGRSGGVGVCGCDDNDGDNENNGNIGDDGDDGDGGGGGRRGSGNCNGNVGSADSGSPLAR